jgi:beta-lactamase class A
MRHPLSDFILGFAAILFKKRSLSVKTALRIFVVIMMAMLAIGLTRYRAEQFIEKRLKAELLFVGTTLHVDQDAQKTKLNELQIRRLRNELCLELAHSSRTEQLFWWSRVLARFVPVSREFPEIPADTFQQRYCGGLATTAGGTPLGCPPNQLLDEVNKISAVTNGPVGAAFALLGTSEFSALEGNRHFPMQSVYKLPIAMLVLRQVDADKLNLDRRVAVTPADFVSDREFSIKRQYPKGAELSVRELLRFMISESDGTACDVLLKLIGGPEKATRDLRELGVENIVIARYEREMAANPRVSYENWATPEAAIELLKLLHGGNVISEASRGLLLDLMINSRPGPNRIKGLLPSGTVVAHKTGTSATINGVTSATNDIGIITLPDGGQLAIAVFVSDTKADEKTREEVIAKIAEAAWKCWVRK